MKAIKYILGFIGTLSLIVSIFIINSLYSEYQYQMTTNPVSATIAPTPTYPTPESVLPVIDRLGISRETISHIKVTTPEDSSACSSKILSNASACYMPSSQTLVFPTGMFSYDPIVVNSIVAHEYMHYVWANMSATEKAELTPYIEDTYNKAKPYLDGRLSNYTFSTGPDSTRLTELHSFIGTELSDSRLPAPLLAHYAKYLPNRSALPSDY